MVEKVERPMPIKCLRWQSVVSGSPSPTPDLHVAELSGTNMRRGERREITSAPGRMSSIALPVVILGEGKSLV